MKAKNSKSIESPSSKNLLGIIDASIAKTDRILADDSNGLFPKLPEGESIFLQNLVEYLRYYVLIERRINNKRLQRILDGRDRPKDEGIYLACGILRSLASTLRVKDGRSNPKDTNGKPIYPRALTGKEEARRLLSGPVGLRDLRRQEGTKRKRLPKINEWIEQMIARRPTLTRDGIWDEAPEWISEQIGKDRFVKRVSQVRRFVAERANTNRTGRK